MSPPGNQNRNLIEVKAKQKKFSLGMAIMEKLKNSKFGRSSNTQHRQPSMGPSEATESHEQSQEAVVHRRNKSRNAANGAAEMI